MDVVRLISITAVTHVAVAVSTVELFGKVTIPES
jgi:hypothetical protein